MGPEARLRRDRHRSEIQQLIVRTPGHADDGAGRELAPVGIEKRNGHIVPFFPRDAECDAHRIERRLDRRARRGVCNRECRLH